MNIENFMFCLYAIIIYTHTHTRQKRCFDVIFLDVEIVSVPVRIFAVTLVAVPNHSLLLSRSNHIESSVGKTESKGSFDFASWFPGFGVLVADDVCVCVRKYMLRITSEFDEM